jgi:hypothetical protein
MVFEHPAAATAAAAQLRRQHLFTGASHYAKCLAVMCGLWGKQSAGQPRLGVLPETVCVASGCNHLLQIAVNDMSGSGILCKQH